VIKSFDYSIATRWGLNILALLAGIVALRLAQSILIPIIIAILLTALLWPAVRWMNRTLRFTWVFACGIAVTGLVVLNIFVSLGCFMTVPKLMQDLPDLRLEKEQVNAYQVIRERISTFVPLDAVYLPEDAEKSNVFRYIRQTLQEGPLLAEIFYWIGYYSNMWLYQWVLVIFLVLFMLVEGPMLGSRLAEIFGPATDTKAKALDTFADMAAHVRTYLVWRTIINFGLALIVGLIYQRFFHLKQAWTWALLTAILFYIPYLGPLAAGVFPVVEAFLTVSPASSLELIFVYAIIMTIEGYFLIPVVMGHSLELNMTTVMLACLFWELVWGLPGLFLAMPIMSAIKSVCTSVPDWRPWANLMSTERGAVALRPSLGEFTVPDIEMTQVMSLEEMKKVARRTGAESRERKAESRP
jgi:predicted PurR-regulated permease PerM